MLPAVGSASIWRPPVALYFLVTGAVWEGLVLIALGALVIALADNLLRPYLIGMDTKLPDYIVLISTLGAIAVFGLNGVVIGPVIAAIFIATWDIFSARIGLEKSVASWVRAISGHRRRPPKLSQRGTSNDHPCLGSYSRCPQLLAGR
jgi:predicted PurR-regulated permease PerM